MALTDSLISYWTLDEASGTRADSHGTNDLTDNNTVGSATGVLGNAADFEMNNTEHLSHADNADLSTGNTSFTIQAWVKLESKTLRMQIVTKDVSGGREYSLYYDFTADRFGFFIFDPGTAVTVLADDLGSPSVGVWYLLHAWLDTDANQIGIAVNASATPNTTATSGNPNDGAAQFRIGAREFASFEEYLDGIVDEVGFWKRALTSQERTDLYNGGTGLAYPFSTTYTLTATGGSATVTGTASTLRVGMPAASGVVALSGTAASLEHGYYLTAGGGSVTVSGTAANLNYSGGSITLTAASGAITSTGTAATLTKGSLPSRTYKRRLTFTNPSSTLYIPSNYRFTIKLTNSNFNFAQVTDAAGSDLQVRDEQRTSLLDFYLAHYDSGDELSYLEIELLEVVAPSSSAAAYLYYNAVSPVSPSSWENTYTGVFPSVGRHPNPTQLYGLENYNNDPTIVRCDDGTLLVTFRSAASHLSTDSVLKLMRSTNNGATWTTSTLVENAGRDIRPGRGFNIIPSTGRVFFTWNEVVTIDDEYNLWQIYSDDSGASWSSPAAITVPLTDWAFLYGQIRELSDGTLLMPAYGANTSDTAWRAVLMQSTDGGTSWTLKSTIAYDGSNDYDETDIYCFSDTFFIAVVRKEASPIQLVQYTSTNGGASWGSGVNLFPGVSPWLTEMPSGGVMLSVGKRNSSPYGVQLYATYDQGAVWTGGSIPIPVLSPFSVNNLGYSSLARLPNDNYLMVYYTEDGTGSSDSTSIYLTTISEPTLYQNTLEDFEDNTLADWYLIQGSGTAISTIQPHHGTYVLRVHDTNSTLHKAVRYLYNLLPLQRNGRMTAWVYIAAYGLAPTVVLLDDGDMIRVEIFVDTATGNWVWWNGTSTQTFTTPVAATLNGWHKVEIDFDASTDAYRCFFDDTFSGSIGRYQAGNFISKVGFFSGSSAGTGDDFYIDDISIDQNYIGFSPTVTVGVEEPATDFPLTAASGTVTLTGTAASLEYSRILSAESGAVTLTGQVASLEVGSGVVAESGAIVLSGSSASTVLGSLISAEPGAATVTGSESALEYSRLVSAAGGSIILTGTAANLVYTPVGGYELAAETGSVTLTGGAASLQLVGTLSAESGSVLFSGSAANLVRGQGFTAGSGTVTITGEAASLLTGNPILTAEGGTVLFTGSSAELTGVGPGRRVRYRVNFVHKISSVVNFGD